MASTFFNLTTISESQSQKATSANTNLALMQTAIKGLLSKSVAGGSNVTLTEIEAGNAVLKFTGALTGNINVIVPTSTKPYLVHNATSGDYTLTVKTSGGSGVIVPQGARWLLYCDGTDVLKQLLDVPITLTDAATIATNAALSNHFRVTLGGNRTLGNPTGAIDGQRLMWELIQDATGSRTITLDTKFALGTDISSVTLTTTANKRDFLTAVYNATADKFYVVDFKKGY